jgi:hypothetical protein
MYRKTSPGRREIIAETPQDWKNLVGTAYALGGQDRTVGLNCYGLVREVYKSLSVELPLRSEIALTAELVQTEGKNWIKIPAPEPYAVALMRSVEGLHLGVVTPDMQLLRCDTSKGVVVSPLKRYDHIILSYYRYRPGGEETLPVAGKGDVGRAIGGVLTAVAAFALAPMTMGGSLAGWSALSGWALAGAIGASMAITIAGSMVVDALFPLPPAETPALSGWDNNLKDSRHYTWDGIVNDTRPGLAKPWLFGMMKVGGQIISEKTRYDSEGNEYLDMLLCPVGHRITRFDDIRINDTEYIYYDQAQIAMRPGDDEQGIIDIFNKIYTQYRSGAKIPYDASLDDPDSSLAFTAKKDITGCRFVLSAPRGIYEIVGSTPCARDVVCRLQYKKHIDSIWSFVLGDAAWGDEIPFIDRASGVFSGTSNPYTLTDTGSGGGADANFSDKVPAAADFELVIGGSTYYCTQTGTLDATTIQFNAFTDAGRSVAKTGAFIDGVYRIQDGDLTFSTTGFTGRIWTGFNTDIDINAIKFRLISHPTVDGSTTFTFSRYRVYYRKSGASAWTLHGTYEIGACYYGYSAAGSWDIVISGLDLDKYDVRIDWASDCCTNPSGTHNVNAFAIDNVYLSAQSEDHTISGDSSNPLEAVTQVIELLNLEEDTYNFRIWRTTEDKTSVLWSDDIFLNTYSEIIDQELSYPGHALIGVSAMATDRLSGTRPAITSIAIGPPLSIPDEEDRYDTEVAEDEGLVTGTGNLVNTITVDGMRKVIVEDSLPAPGNSSILYYWLVFMDSEGYAQPDRLLTKFYKRIHTWGHSFVITGANDILKLSYDGGSATDVDIPDGDYTGDDLALALQAAIDTAFTISSTVTFDGLTRKFNIDAGAGHTFTYTHTGSDAGATLGYTGDHPAAQTITSNVATTPRTRLYLQSTDAIPAGTEIMVFCENYGDTDSLTWALAKIMLEGSHGRITADKIIWDSLAEFDEYNKEIVDGEQRHKFDALIDFSEDLWGLVLRIAQQAEAQIVPYGNKFKIIIDKAVSVPVQIFGEGNTKNVHVYPIPGRERANILVVTYKDENLNYDDKTISEEDVQEGEYPIIKTLSPLVGVTRETEVRRYLRRLLRYNRYVDHEIEFEAGNESIEAETGDVFAFQSQANDFAASGRIQGTNNTGDKVVLDRLITIDSGETYRLRVWGSDGAIYTWQGVLTGETIQEISKPTGLAVDNEKPYECNYILSKTSEINTLYRTKWIKRSPDTMFSTIRGIVYREEVYD